MVWGIGRGGVKAVVRSLFLEKNPHASAGGVFNLIIFF